MHQPYYKDDLTNTYLLPWVRLHAVKDYHKMVALLDGYPRLKQTFNLVPSLLAQIDEYSRGEARDLFLNLSRRPAYELSVEEQNFLIRWLRESPQTLRVQQSPRYLELASREPVAEAFTTDDIRDLQVWSNLAWCDPAWVDRDTGLTALKVKDHDFSEADKDVLFDAQMQMLRSVIPKYRELADKGQIELTTSPYYHPILPLICHVDSARTASPGIQLPHRHFSHREAADQQIALGLVTVALDGENACEFYPRDGHDFLNALYTELERSPDVVSTTVHDFLEKSPARRPLHRLFTGSWINGSLDTWIGDPEHTVAWDLLAETRDWLDEYARNHPHRHEQLAGAWREILITEGSDWFWWFSRRHDSGMDVMWDNQFRLHLRNVYKQLEAKPPSRLFEPIIVKEGQVNIQRPVTEFTPHSAADPAWSRAGRFEVSSGFGALHRPSGLASRVHYGSDQDSLHLKIESSRGHAG